MVQLPYKNRREAGQVLAQKMMHYADYDDVLILALPRGGVPVAYEVAQTLEEPMDVLVVRKLGVPGHEESAMGAIAFGGQPLINESLVAQLNISRREIDAVIGRERAELQRRETAYRENRPMPQIEGRTIILIDDGLATGATMLAAVQAIRADLPGEIIVGVPVGSAEVCAMFEREADDVICAMTPEPFQAVGLWYADFPQITDEEVRGLLADAKARFGA